MVPNSNLDQSALEELEFDIADGHIRNDPFDEGSSHFNAILVRGTQEFLAVLEPGPEPF